MSKGSYIVRAVVSSLIVTLMLSCSASSVVGKKFIASDLTSVILEKSYELDMRHGLLLSPALKKYSEKFSFIKNEDSEQDNSYTRENNSDIQKEQELPDFFKYLSSKIRISDVSLELGVFSITAIFLIILLWGIFLYYLVASCLKLFYAVKEQIKQIRLRRDTTQEDLPTSQLGEEQLFSEDLSDNRKDGRPG